MKHICSLMTSLGQMIIHNSPPKSTPRKLLAPVKTVEKAMKEISPGVFGESFDADPFGLPETPNPDFSLRNDNENESVRRFLQKNPHVPKESIIPVNGISNICLPTPRFGFDEYPETLTRVRQGEV